MNKLIAIAEDEKDLSEILSIKLNQEGYKTKIFANGIELLNFCKSVIPDLILLDIMMPKLDGIETCKLIRKESKLQDIPIIFITAKSAESDIVVGHEVGGNDYLIKPISSKVLLAKIKRLLNKTKNISGANFLILNEIKLDMDSYSTFINDKKIDLTRTEFLLLEALIKNQGRVLSRDQLVKRKRIWGDDKIIYDRTIDVHVKNLREKLASSGKIIKTVRGIGYIIDTND
ncbi:MAG: response regulator transcription factor [bacterium]